MPSLKDIKLRIKSIKTTQQATKAMKLMAATRLRKAQDILMRMRPYADKLNELLGRVVASLEGSDFTSEYAPEGREIKNVLLVVITSNRGLAGAFNINICKEALALIESKYSDYQKAGRLQILCIGKKGYEFFSKRKYTIYNGQQYDLFTKLNYTEVENVANIVMKGYVDGKWDKVELVFNEFKNMLTQNRKSEQFLPVAKPASTQTKVQEYLYEPAKEEIITALIPKILHVRFYRAILESNLGEQAARMLAMDNATENAQDLIDALQLSYNKARQAAITKEIIEIVSGANALAG